MDNKNMQLQARYPKQKEADEKKINKDLQYVQNYDFRCVSTWYVFREELNRKLQFNQEYKHHKNMSKKPIKQIVEEVTVPENKDPEVQRNREFIVSPIFWLITTINIEKFETLNKEIA